MAQKTFISGDVLTASDVNTYLMGEGGAWTTWGPAVTQSGAVTVTNTRSVYARWGRLIVATLDLTVTGSGTGSNGITVTIPVNAAANGFAAGVIELRDDSASDIFRAFANLNTATTFRMSPASSTGTANLGAGTSPFTAGLASGDTISGTIVYEAAT